jgi:hypothetical protein
MEDLSLPQVQLTNPDKKKKGLSPRKKKLVEALGKHMGLVTYACREIGITRETYYQWLKNDELFKKAVEDLNEAKDDIIEKVFLSMVLDKNPQVVIHAAKTKLRHRHYNEPSHNINFVNNEGPTYSIEIIAPKKEVKNE